MDIIFNKSKMEEYLKNGGDVNAKNNNGDTKLHNAVFFGQLELVKLLLSNGADINIKCRRDFTPLHVAYSMGHMGIVKFLIENGADVNAKNYRGLVYYEL